MPFGKISSRHPDIIRVAAAIGRTPAALSMKMGNIASLDPAITSTGRSGLRAASANDRAMWDEMTSDWDRFAFECEQALIATETTATTPEPVERVVPDYDDLPVGEDRVTLTTARIGQNFFRAAVLSAYNERCCITGLAVPRLLVASHIVPWHIDGANRTNPQNGLLLSVLHDKAFDTGLLTINDDMTVRVSREHIASADAFFATAVGHYDGRPISLPEKFAPDRDFLAYHREHVFQG
ncbi:MAG: HNH endonuclease [Chloroflexi bacterium]|nr:HNH endonuclease [Chloroflexota bacterium]MYD48017.1 HNH endonuclease [Chloroflexota bacterium]